MNITEFLIWLANSGGSIICVSWLLERWQWYQGKTPDMKRGLFFGFSVLVTVIAYCVLTYVPADILGTIAPFFQMVYACFVTIYLGTKFHAETKVSKEEPISSYAWNIKYELESIREELKNKK